jgi:hypothetical protein
MSVSVHRRYDVIAIIVVVICIMAYASIRSEFRLRSTMPAEFFESSTVPREKRAVEERLAKAYWKCAVTQVQWRYGYAHRLPEQAPPDFSVTVEQAGRAANDQNLRARYWQKLRELWGVSALWQQRYEWNTISLRNSLQSAGQWLENHMRRIVGNS